MINADLVASRRGNDSTKDDLTWKISETDESKEDPKQPENHNRRIKKSLSSVNPCRLQTQGKRRSLNAVEVAEEFAESQKKIAADLRWENLKLSKKSKKHSSPKPNCISIPSAIRAIILL